MITLTESEWGRALQLVGRLKDLPQAPRGAVLDVLRATGERPEILSLVETQLKLTSEQEQTSEDPEGVRSIISPDLDRAHREGVLPPESAPWRLHGLLQELYEQEANLKKGQLAATRALLQIGRAIRAVEQTLREVLRSDPLPRELVHETLEHFDERVLVSRLQEVKEKGGLELDQFVGELEQVVRKSE